MLNWIACWYPKQRGLIKSPAITCIHSYWIHSPMELSLHVCGFHKTWKPNDWPNFPHYTIDYFILFFYSFKWNVNKCQSHTILCWFSMISLPKSRLYWLQDEEAFVKGRGDLNPLGQHSDSKPSSFYTNYILCVDDNNIFKL